MLTTLRQCDVSFLTCFHYFTVLTSLYSSFQRVKNFIATFLIISLPILSIYPSHNLLYYCYKFFSTTDTSRSIEKRLTDCSYIVAKARNITDEAVFKFGYGGRLLKTPFR